MLTALQGLNFLAWGVQAVWPFAGLPLQFVHMAFVGLLGGAMYVNTFFAIVADPHINESDREMCINLTSVFPNLGIVSSALFDLIAAATFLK